MLSCGSSRSSSSSSSSSFGGSSSSSSSSSSSKKAPRVLEIGVVELAMPLTPAVHVTVVLRERLSEYLHCHSASESSILYADKLGAAYWIGTTLDQIVEDCSFILPPDEYASIMGFCKLHYPLAYATIPAGFRALAIAGLSCSKHDPATTA